MDSQEHRIKNLIPNCIAWKRDSQQALYKELYSYGMAICMRYVDNHDEAIEILHDGFLKVYRKLDTYEITKPFKPWFSRIVVNTAINFYNQKNRKPILDGMDDNLNKAGEEGIMSGITYREVLGFLNTLPPSYRTVFNLHAIEGYSHEEIGAMLNISPGTSKSHLFKARNQLKKILTHFFTATVHEKQ